MAAMSKRVKSNLPLLYLLLQKLPSAQAGNILGTLTAEQINAIGEVAVNILYNTLPITISYKGKFIETTRPQTGVGYIGDSRISLKKRRSFLQANHQVVSLLLNAANPMLKGLME